MIAWKRTLGWALCWAVAAAPIAAEEPAAAGAAEVESVAPAIPADDALVPADPTGEGDPEAVDPTAAPATDLPDTEPAAETAVAPDAATEAPAPESAQAPESEAKPVLGAIAYDSEGRQGRIHIVVPGDTLWGISTAYLDTPWVWPSIWNDNGDIENPHRIYPGDRIWITPNEMRRLTEEEAAQMLANVPAARSGEEPPAAFEDAVPGMEAPAPARSVRVSSRETAGLISPEAYQSSASVVGRLPERTLLSQEDGVYIGLGEGEVEPGDEFTVFRTNQKVMDPDTGELLGYHVDFLGWLRVTKASPETSLATIRMSTGEVVVGDRVMPREPLPPEIDVRTAPEGVDGKITFFPGRRVLLGSTDFVYLNRGTLDGLEVGSPLEVYRSGYQAPEPTRDEKVAVPDRVIAKMLVVRAEEETAVAMVMSADTELELGDRFRGEGQ